MASKIKMILFDLDGTLLPMNQDEFIKAYFGGLVKKLAPHGYKSDELIKAIWKGTMSMVQNDGAVQNEVRFWDTFAQIYGDKAREDESILADFYDNEFDEVRLSCGFNKCAREVLDLIKKKGLRVALATNPVFPPIATQKRIKWAGLDPEDFELYTNYENSRYCKPSLEYYRDIVNTLGVDPTECLMVGNDVNEDMVAETLGMRVFLLADCIINKDNKDISALPHGGFEALIDYINAL